MHGTDHVVAPFVHAATESVHLHLMASLESPKGLIDAESEIRPEGLVNVFVGEKFSYGDLNLVGVGRVPHPDFGATYLRRDETEFIFRVPA